ncbi:MAG: deoxynucleoside kinase [Synergistaceae bacterium]|nr:deoxynucleoside kinase [Synergistota bacterium]NLM72082.1 deoxynucleoside kinase [Synergistaceae bacterium]
MGRVQIIVEGMTASGKSTVVNLLSKRLGLRVMPEDFRDQYDLLRRFHSERRWAFPMQLNFLVNRFAQYLCASESDEYILDRSVFGDKIYATLYYKLGYFRDSQFGTYLMLYDSLLKHLTMPRLIVVLSCPFKEILRRIHERGRQDEIDAGEEYWRSLYDAYSSFLDFVRSEIDLSSSACMTFDLGDPAFIHTPDRVDRFVEDVRNALKGQMP